jgi:hypothetical protein
MPAGSRPGRPPHGLKRLRQAPRNFEAHSLTTGTTYRVYLGGGACAGPCVAMDRWGNRAVFLEGERTDKVLITSLVAELASSLRIGGLIGSR